MKIIFEALQRLVVFSRIRLTMDGLVRSLEALTYLPATLFFLCL